MRTTLHKLPLHAVLAAAVFAAGTAWAALPPPTPAQQQAAAAKKAQTDAQAAKDKEALAASMDAVAARWRSRAAQQGWKSHAPVAIAAAPSALPAASPAPAAAAPAPAATPPVSAAAEAANNLALGATPGNGAAPRSPEALAAAKVPVKSEKLGTAPPSRDVKAGPTKAVPQSTGPTVQKGSPDASKK